MAVDDFLQDNGEPNSISDRFRSCTSLRLTQEKVSGLRFNIAKLFHLTPYKADKP
jgi:hypothetical protein